MTAHMPGWANTFPVRISRLPDADHTGTVPVVTLILGFQLGLVTPSVLGADRVDRLVVDAPVATDLDDELTGLVGCGVGVVVHDDIVGTIS